MGNDAHQETNPSRREKGEPVFVAKREHKLLRIGAAAHELGLHPITVRRWIKAGRIQAVPMGREVRVPRGSGRAPGGQNRWAIVGPLWQGERAWAKGGSRYATRTAANLGQNGAQRRCHPGALRHWLWTQSVPSAVAEAPQARV